MPTYRNLPTVNNLVLSVKPQSSVVVKGQPKLVSSLPTIAGTDGSTYAVVLTAGEAQAVEGVKFVTGDSMCVRIGDKTEVQLIPSVDPADQSMGTACKARLYAIAADGGRRFGTGYDFVNIV